MALNRSRSRLLKNLRTDPLSSLSLLTLLFSLLFFLSYYSLSTPNYHISPSTKTLNSQCSISQLAQKFLWYAPHSGFSNQVSEFKNAILMAAILNRTLIVPPVLDHHAVALGSCPKFRVSHPNKIRVDVWNHVVQLLRTGRWVTLIRLECGFYWVSFDFHVCGIPKKKKKMLFLFNFFVWLVREWKLKLSPLLGQWSY